MQSKNNGDTRGIYHHLSPVVAFLSVLLNITQNAILNEVFYKSCTIRVQFRESCYFNFKKI